MPDPKKMDLAEIQEQYEEARERYKNAQLAYNEEKNKPALEKKLAAEALQAEKLAFQRDYLYRRKMEKALKRGSDEPTED